MSIQPLAVGRSGSGIVMNASAFYVLAVTRSGTVIQTDGDAASQTGSELMHDESEHDGGEFFGGPSDADEAIIKAVPIVLGSASHQPSTGRAAVIGEEHARDDDRQT